MRELKLSAGDLIKGLLGLRAGAGLCLLDSAGATHGNSHQLIAGIYPREICRIESQSAGETLAILEQKINAHPKSAAVFTISYDFGLKLEKIKSRHMGIPRFP